MKTVMLALAFTFLISFDIEAYKPKTHLYLALQAINGILSGSDDITINGKTYPVDPFVASAIRAYPGYFLSGVIGPDGFPDIAFGQTKIHPDSRCSGSESNWDCPS